MAIFSGRLRCGIPLFQRILRTESSVVPQFSSAARAFGNPSTATSKGLRNFVTQANVTCLSCPTSQLWRHTHNALGRYRFSSSASCEPTDMKSNQFVDCAAKTTGNSTAPGKTQDAGFSPESKHPESQSIKKRRRRSSTKRTQFSDSDTEPDLSVDDLVKLVAEKEEQLKLKHKEIENMQDKVLRSYAEMENVLDRTKREGENTKKFSIQNFAKNLLDVADNLGRASSVVKDSFSKIDSSEDTAGAVPLLKILLEGVEMTEKQLGEVFRKSGVEKFDPTNEQFDPNRHHAVFQIPDHSKPPGTVAAVLKPGYMLYDRVLRPAEVGVTDSANNESD